MSGKVIVWDNDIGWCERIRKELEKRGIAAEEVETAEDLWLQLRDRQEEILYKQTDSLECQNEILAVLLAEESLREAMSEEWQKFLQKICERKSVPVLFVSETQEITEELRAFEMGVSDYMCRERGILVCIARLFACFDKKHLHDTKNVTEQVFSVDERNQCFQVGKVSYSLTVKEYLVLSCLLNRKGEVVTREELLYTVWGEELPVCRRVLDTVVKQLRHKLAPTQYTILAHYGKGYSLERKMSKK